MYVAQRTDPQKEESKVSYSPFAIKRMVWNLRYLLMEYSNKSATPKQEDKTEQEKKLAQDKKSQSQKDKEKK